MIIYNQFWIPDKVPSLNELNEFRAIQGPTRPAGIITYKGKGRKRGYVYNKYNEIKQHWSDKVYCIVRGAGFEPVESCHFSYLVVEKTIKRDPSNVCASSIKFIEDGLVKAGVIPNDGWKNVLSIAPEWLLDRKGDNGVFIVMSDGRIPYECIVSKYWRHLNLPVTCVFDSRSRELRRV